MAVYTQINETALLAMLEHYAVGDVLSFKGITQGVQNSNYMLETTCGRYILTLYEAAETRESLPFFLGLMQHLAARDIACPTPIKRRDGSFMTEVETRPATLVNFLQGLSVRTPQPHHCRALGRAMARLHLQAQDFDMSRPNNLGQANWTPMFKPLAARADELATGVRDEINHTLSMLDEQWPQHLPRGIIHADLFPDNVFFLRDEISGLIDFYFASNDFYAYDLAIALNAWCFESDMSFNVTCARMLIEGYQESRTLEENEIAALPILATGAAMRFALTRLADWLNPVADAIVRPKNPQAFIRRMRFHRSVRTSQDYGINQI